MQKQEELNSQLLELSKLYKQPNGQIKKKIQHIPQTTKIQKRQAKPVVLEIFDVEEGNVQQITQLSGPWTEQEHQNYLKVIRKYENQLKQGKIVRGLHDLIKLEVPTRNLIQIKRHHNDHNPYKQQQSEQKIKSNATTELQRSDADEWIKLYKQKQNQNDVQWIPPEEVIEYNPETYNQFQIPIFRHTNSNVFENGNNNLQQPFQDSFQYDNNIDNFDNFDNFDQDNNSFFHQMD